jgi:hypothetical protein
VFQGKFNPPGRSAHFEGKRTGCWLLAFQKLFKMELSCMAYAVANIPPIWRLPTGGWLKLNWDTALNRTGSSPVAFNWRGAGSLYLRA